MSDDHLLDDVRQFGHAYVDSRRATEQARLDLQAAIRAAHDGGHSEVRIADAAGVDRMTVRKALGK